MRVIIVSFLLLVTVVNARGNHASSEIDSDELPGVFGFPGRGRKTHSHLPLFSKKESGKGKGSSMYYEYYGKGSKGYKSSKKDKKSEKKDKKEKYEKYYYWEQPTSSRKPTVKPASSPMPTPTDKTGSGSEDFHPTNGSSSEDCPPARPPSAIPPSPSNINPPPTISTDDKNVQRVEMEVYAIDYTLFQTDRAPIKVDFIALQKVTETYLKDHMVDEYKTSTQVKMVDFTTSFVTAHFTPGQPVHIQYNSTAIFDEISVFLPTSKTLLRVLEKSLENPKLYTDELTSQLSEVNPFSSTTNTIFTDPKDAPATRSASTRANKVFVAAGVGVVMLMTLTIVTTIFRRRNGDNPDGDEYHEAFHKKIRSDTTVAGETFVSETNDSLYDGNTSIFSSIGLVENDEIRNYEDPLRKPRTLAEIEDLLSIGDGDTI